MVSDMNMKQTGVRIPDTIFNRVEEVCKETGATMSSFIRDAVTSKLMEEEKRLAEHKRATDGNT